MKVWGRVTDVYHDRSSVQEPLGPGQELRSTLYLFPQRISDRVEQKPSLWVPGPFLTPVRLRPELWALLPVWESGWPMGASPVPSLDLGSPDNLKLFSRWWLSSQAKDIDSKSTGFWLSPVSQ